MRIGSLKLSCALLALWPGLLTAKDTLPPPPTAVGPPTVAVKETTPTAVVYLEHDGPYWALGPKFQQLAELRATVTGAGPFFTVYPGHPLGTMTRSKPAYVGFICDGCQGRSEIQRPFLIGEWPRELVAYTRFEGPASATLSLYSYMREWTTLNGYAATGPVVEIYASRGTGTGVEPTTFQTEIRMPVRSLTDRRADAPPMGIVAVTPGTDAQDSPTISDRSTLPDSRPAPTAPASTTIVSTVLSSNGTEPSHARHSTASTTSPGVAARTEGPGQAIDPARAKPSAEEPPLNDAAASSDDATLDSLYVSQRMPQVAERLLPVGSSMSDAEVAWMGQFIFRVQALAKGVEQVYPQEAREIADLKALAVALERRYREQRPDGFAGSAARVVVRAAPNQDRAAAARQAVMRDMDSLLGRVALRTVDAAGAVSGLIELLSRMETSLADTRP